MLGTEPAEGPLHASQLLRRALVTACLTKSSLGPSMSSLVSRMPPRRFRTHAGRAKVEGLDWTEPFGPVQSRPVLCQPSLIATLAPGSRDSACAYG
jgi:hypothetical protein